MNTKAVWTILGVIALVFVAYLIGQGSTNSDVQATGNTPVATASYDDMMNSCQSIADANLRNGFYETDYTPQTDTQPRKVSDSIYYNASQSICYFTEHIIRYPAVNSVSDPYVVEGDYLYTAALSPNGVMQNPAQGDSETGGPLPMAYCTINTYHYPTDGSTETHCVDFQLKQSGAGTNNYHANALGVGATVSQSQYEALVQEFMSTAQ